MNAYSIAIIGVAGTILGASVGSLFTYWFSKDLTRQAAVIQSFVNASSEFKKAWLPFYIDIFRWREYFDEVLPEKVISTVYKMAENTNLKASTIIFQRYLSMEDRVKFNSFCDRLFNIDKGNGDDDNYKLFYAENASEKEQAY